MEDSQIVELYWAREERAVGETAQKYGPYCRSVSWNILRDLQDVEECLNDTWLQAWNAMPPQRPVVLRAFLGRITRNLSLKVYEKNHAQKRGGGQICLALEELEDCLSDGPELRLEAAELSRFLDRFVRTLPQRDGMIFVCRYWYLEPVAEIARRYRLAVGTVKSSLHRSRNKLRISLEQEGLLP